MAEPLDLLKLRAKKLDEMIVDRDAKDYFLGLAKKWMKDVECKVAPGIEFMLPLIDQQLKNAEEAVAKYGPNLRIVR